jgi:hypothetical protein
MAQMLIPQHDIKVLHLELTTKCQASCPQCDRMIPDRGYSQDHELTLGKIQSMFSEDFVRQLDKMFACGTFGDPAAAKECVEIFRWFKSVNPNITLGMNTNGGLRDTKFWINMGELLSSPRDYCVFSIDGMATTNDIYRRGVMWHRVMMNADTFISNGGRAHWDMLVFEHNKHHVQHCKEHARKMGFVRFRSKISARHREVPVAWLKPPADVELPLNTGPVQCHAQDERSMYVAATGDILPCCFFGSEIFRWTPELEHLVSTPDALPLSWQTQPHVICQHNCGTSHNRTSFEQQFVEETAFD